VEHRVLAYRDQNVEIPTENALFDSFSVEAA